MVTAVTLSIALRPAPTVPVAREVLPPPLAGIELTLGMLSLDGKKLLDLPSLDEQQNGGFDAQWKANGPNDLLVVPLSKALGAAPRRAVLEVRLAPETPYRMMIETMFTAHKSGFETTHLSTTESRHAPALDFVYHGPKGTGPQPPLGVSVFIVGDGLSIKLKGGNVGPGCSGIGIAGLAVPGSTNFVELSSCLHAQRASLDAHPSGTVTANPSVPVWHVLSVVHVLRCGQRACPKTWSGPDLFGPIMFGVAR